MERALADLGGGEEAPTSMHDARKTGKQLPLRHRGGPAGAGAGARRFAKRSEGPSACWGTTRTPSSPGRRCAPSVPGPAPTTRTGSPSAFSTGATRRRCSSWSTAFPACGNGCVWTKKARRGCAASLRDVRDAVADLRRIVPAGAGARVRLPGRAFRSAAASRCAGGTPTS
ncbi:hypothetical protein HBB16_16860 [Pseudonocardia sp. MCCB 268]|nr:hypothetical protein [Pseudonocardia cytotoxica]